MQIPTPPQADRTACLVVSSQVVFPRQVETLEISRAENLRALAATPEDSLVLAVPLPGGGATGSFDPQSVVEVGTLCRVLDRIRLPNGSTRIVVQGLRRSRLVAVELAEGPEGLYLRATPVEPEAGDPDPEHRPEVLERALGLVRDLVETDDRYSPELARVLALNNDESGPFSDLVARRLHLAYDDRARLLVEVDPARRLEALTGILQRELVRAQLASGLQGKVRERLREEFLEKQLEVIRRELGTHDPIQDQADDYERRIDERALPARAEAQALRELARFRRADAGSPEASRIRGWLEWVLELPWYELTPDPEGDEADFARVVERLDETHSGLKRVKDRVIEYLAVRSLGGTASGTVLCFSGPPGTGKTSMALAVAQALGREFVHVPVGPASEEDLRGSHFAHPGSAPGMVLQGLHRVGSSNPVVLLDEIDALLASEGGGSGVLMGLLDREQNRAFVDHFLGTPFDLSQCIFIVTAGDTEELPDALVDRLEVISFDSYTESEKLQIARRHLIPMARANAGLNRYQFKVTPGALREIVREYTEEAGVRQLQRVLGALARKGAVRVLEGLYGLQVKKSDLPELLGPPNVDEDLHHGQPAIGVAQGLAWTSVGGSMLPIEALAMPGQGRTILTGSVGDVMRESVQTAISYVRTRFEDLELPADALDSLDLHLHFPSGATPKDGPSAGIAIAASLVSLLTRIPVRHDVAMTGEMSLHGAVLPVGGLKEKLLAALRAGIRTVVVPARNGEEILRLPPEVRRELDVQLVEHVEEVLALALMTTRRSQLGRVLAGTRRARRYAGGARGRRASGSADGRRRGAGRDREGPR